MSRAELFDHSIPALSAIGGAIAAFFAWLEARQAKRNTKGTGNGFAAHVLGSLDRIEQKVDDHIESHNQETSE